MTRESPPLGAEALQSFFGADLPGMRREERFVMSRDTSSMARAKARFTVPQAFAGRATAGPANRFFTNHYPLPFDTNHGFLSASMPCSPLFTIVHHCSRLFTIVRYCSAKKYCPGKCLHAVSRSRKALRRRQNDAMLRKEYVLDSANRGTFYLALTSTRDSLQPDALASKLNRSLTGGSCSGPIDHPRTPPASAL